MRERLCHRCALLMDLLEHERLISVLLAAILVPIDFGRDRATGTSIGAADAHRVGPQRHDLVVLQEDHFLGISEERGDRGRDELLVLTETDDQWTLLPDTDEGVGLVVAHRDKCVVTRQVIERPPDSVREVPRVVECDQMGHDLRIGVGAELHEVPGKPRAQLDVVLDDPVEDDPDAAAGVLVGMRIAFSDRSVGRPSRMPDPARARDGARGGAITARERWDGPGRLPKRHLQGVKISDRPDAVNRIPVAPRDPGRVIAAVFEPAQALQQDRAARPLSDISDDSAHQLPPMNLMPDLITLLIALDINRDTGLSSFTHLIASRPRMTGSWASPRFGSS